MIVYLANKTQFRDDILKERGRLAHSYKLTTAMNHLEQILSFSA